MSTEEELRNALERMCKYVNYLGNIVLPQLGNANYAEDFVKQYETLLNPKNNDRLSFI
jgi:ribonucleotide reductase beta subunit family protein with ferritin-like domain